LGRLWLDRQVDENPDPDLIAQALLEQVRAGGIDALNWGLGAKILRHRIGFLRHLAEADWPDLSDQGLIETLDRWLPALLVGLRRLKDLKPEDLESALRSLMPWDQQRTLDQALPPRWTAPTGNSFAIDYSADSGPRVELRVQEVFGLNQHPTVAGGKIPLTLVLLSPAQRPIQTTKDLPGFWSGSWKDVRSDMRGRYPKHVWPEDPASAVPTARAKPHGT